jgi:SAM-dependent methyltransferase
MNSSLGRFERDFVAALADPCLVDLQTAVHPKDEMFQYILRGRPDSRQAFCQYLRTGKDIHDAVAQIVGCRFGGFHNLNSFLDFACGYGRFMRFLVNDIQRNLVWAAEISRDAVLFQREQFGVHAFESALRPEDVRFERRFDCVFVMSLFTHLPASTFTRWLQTLHRATEDDGILLFTVHDESLNPGVVPASGLWFEEESEIESLSTKDYGCTVVTEAFVGRAIQEATDGRSVYYRYPQAVNGTQDLYVVSNITNTRLADFRFSWTPVGNVESCKKTAKDKLLLSGWAGDVTPDATVDHVEIRIDGAPVQRFAPVEARPDVVAACGNNSRLLISGFTIECPLDEHTKDDSTITVSVVSTSKLRSVLFHNFLSEALQGPIGFCNRVPTFQLSMSDSA